MLTRSQQKAREQDGTLLETGSASEELHGPSATTTATTMTSTTAATSSSSLSPPSRRTAIASASSRNPSPPTIITSTIDTSIFHSSVTSPKHGPYSPLGPGFFAMLPTELSLHVLSYLTVTDLANASMTCRRLLTLANSKLVLSKVRFEDLWPLAEEPTLLVLFKRAAMCGNVDACIKLGVAYLYGEGVPASAEEAGHHIAFAEQHAATPTPFSWIIYRPPWTNFECSKAAVFNSVESIAEVASQYRDSRVWAGKLFYCMAKIDAFQAEVDNAATQNKFKRALELGCSQAALDFHQSTPLHGDRKAAQAAVRSVADRNVHARIYRSLKLLDHEQQAIDDLSGHDIHFLRKTVDVGMVPVRLHAKMRQPELDAYKMRYILIDWMCEVTDMKGYSSATLFLAVHLVDRVLSCRVIPRRVLQLLGIASMVIAGRLSQAEVVTIREASWLTDNTYTYEDIVRMIADIMSTLRGDINFPTVHSYLQLFKAAIKPSAATDAFIDYVAEKLMEMVDTTEYAPAAFAASAVYLARCHASEEVPWPAALAVDLEVSLNDLPVLEFHNALVDSPSVRDHRLVEIQSVEQRYQDRRAVQQLEEHTIDQAYDFMLQYTQSLELEAKMRRERMEERNQKPLLGQGCRVVEPKRSTPLRQITNNMAGPATTTLAMPTTGPTDNHPRQ